MKEINRNEHFLTISINNDIYILSSIKVLNFKLKILFRCRFTLSIDKNLNFQKEVVNTHPGYPSLVLKVSSDLVTYIVNSRSFLNLTAFTFTNLTLNFTLPLLDFSLFILLFLQHSHSFEILCHGNYDYKNI